MLSGPATNPYHFPLPAAAGKPVIVAFDFDGTLSRGTSGRRFLQFLLGPRDYARLMAPRLVSALRYYLRWGDEAALAGFNRAAFRGREAAAVAEAAERYRHEVLPRYLIDDSLDRLRAHQSLGHRCVIVSRGYEVYLRPWARSIGVEDVIATRLVVGPDGRLTGEMPEPSCDGPRKRLGLEALLGARDQYLLHAYGDSRGDHAMLASADRAWIRRSRGFEPWEGAPEEG